MFEISYGQWADELNALFGCKDATSDCFDQFYRWVQGTHWYCNSKWAFSGQLKENPKNHGALYPMEFGVPNCDPINGVNTKSCHCGEAAWVHGRRGYTGDLGLKMRDVWGEFYKTGSFNSTLISSWEEMNFDGFNVISQSEWSQRSILNWDECQILDEIHEALNDYTWGYTLYSQDGPNKP